MTPLSTRPVSKGPSHSGRKCEIQKKIRNPPHAAALALCSAVPLRPSSHSWIATQQQQQQQIRQHACVSAAIQPREVLFHRCGSPFLLFTGSTRLIRLVLHNSCALLASLQINWNVPLPSQRLTDIDTSCYISWVCLRTGTLV